MEQPEAQAAESNVEDRLASFLGGKPAQKASATDESATAQAPEAVPQPVATESNDQQSESDEQDAEQGAYQTPADWVDVEDDSGQVVKVPPSLKDSVLRHADYTRKTQETANLRQVAEDRLQFAEAKEQLLGAVVQDFISLQGEKNRLQQLESIDIGSLFSNDPGQALNLQQQLYALRGKVSDAEKLIGAKASHLQQAIQAHQTKQWALAVDGAKQRIGTVTPTEDAAMLRTVQDLGFSETELKSRFADPRFLQLVHMAVKGRMSSDKKRELLQAVNTAPPVVKPGSSTPGMAAESKYKQLRTNLRKSGDMRDAAKLFLMKGT